MLFFSWLSCLFLAALVVAKEAPTELVIDTTYTPDLCTAKAKKGDQITVHYTGRLFENDKEFDSSVKRGTPLPLTLGVGQVIRGWDEGLLGMCVGEQRRLTIPPAMAYGARGAGGIIPPNAPLVFDCELITLESQGAADHEEL